MAKHEFNEGCMWEGNPWFIRTDEHCGTYQNNKEETPCKHSIVLNSDDSRWKLRQITWGEKKGQMEPWEAVQWIVPRVVVSINEGGHCSTGICLDCILEAAKTLEPKSKERPLVVLSGISGKSDDSRLYANREGLLKLRESIDQLLQEDIESLNAGNAIVSITKTVFKGGHGWHNLEMTLADHDGFPGDACDCGCQEKFRHVEEQYLKGKDA